MSKFFSEDSKLPDATYGFAHTKVQKSTFDPKILEFIGNIGIILNDFESWFMDTKLKNLLSNKYKSTENFNVESNTQYTTKQNRYSIQSTNTVTRNGISENFNFGAEFNKNTNIGMYFKRFY